MADALRTPRSNSNEENASDKHVGEAKPEGTSSHENQGDNTTTDSNLATRDTENNDKTVRDNKDTVCGKSSNDRVCEKIGNTSNDETTRGNNDQRVRDNIDNNRQSTLEVSKGCDNMRESRRHGSPRRGPTLSTSTSSFEALDPHDPNLSHLASLMFSHTSNYLQGELSSVLEDYTLLEQMNRATIAKYADLRQITGSVSRSLTELNAKYLGLQPYLDQIDQIEDSVTKLEAAAYKLDAYARRLEDKFKSLEKK